MKAFPLGGKVPSEARRMRGNKGLCSFLVPNKKGTKEVGPGKALRVALLRAKAALPWEPIPAASPLLLCAVSF